MADASPSYLGNLPLIEILDIGGRKSHYTIGIAGSVTITDLPRETDIQQRLHLGVTPAMVAASGWAPPIPPRPEVRNHLPFKLPP